MSEIFEDIKNEIDDFHNEQDKKREIASELYEQRLEENKVILENSGVRQILEEVRDSGLVKLKLKKDHKTGLFKRIFGSKIDKLDYVPAQIIDNQMYISLQFDERPDSLSEIRVAVVEGQLHIAHGYNRVDYIPIQKGDLANAIAECIKNPLRITKMQKG